MKIITNLNQLNRQFKKPVATIGIFDGMHLGHRKILRAVTDEARRVKGTSVVITFDPHPLRILDMIGAPPLLVSLKHRLNLIKKEGIDVACVINFNESVAKCRAEEFVRRVLIKKLDVYEIIIGAGFRFGKDKNGSIALLKSLGREFGFFVKTIPLYRYKASSVSSTRIRHLVRIGRLEEAAQLLGRPVSILGTVIKGSRRGRILGFPTANINPHHEAIPPSGVYAVYVLLEDKRYKGVLNIGRRPTFDKAHSPKPAAQSSVEPTIEVHISRFNKDIYSKDIEVIFQKKLRDETRFATKEKLIEQIKIDEHLANMVL